MFAKLTEVHHQCNGMQLLQCNTLVCSADLLSKMKVGPQHLSDVLMPSAPRSDPTLESQLQMMKFQCQYDHHSPSQGLNAAC